jgi:Tol biopolymer transport system component
MHHYISRLHTSRNDERIYRAPIGPCGILAPVAVPVGTFNGGAGLPVVTPDELTIYFTSPAGGTGDIYVAHRAAMTDPFGEPSIVSELDSSTTNEEPSWVSADGCDLYFSSDRAGGSGYDLYVAHRGT